MCNKSETIGKIAAALVLFHGDVKRIEKDGTNPHFKSDYATLDNIIDETSPLLFKHGLTVMQFPGGDGEKISVRTMIIHSSGEYIESDPLILKPTKADPQGAGSAITYARRYSYAAALSLPLGDDDDGNAASKPQKPAEAPPARQQTRNTDLNDEDLAAIAGASNAQYGGPSYVSEGQVKMLWAKYKNSPYVNHSPADVFELISAQISRNIEGFEQIHKSEINKVIKWFETAA